MSPTLLLIPFLSLSLSVSAAAPEGGAPVSPPAAEAGLPGGVRNFYGRVTGLVAAVDAEKSEFSIKVSAAVPDALKNKATRPEVLQGMTITVTPLERKDAKGGKSLDAGAAAYIRGAKPGSEVTMDVRASSKGVVFRLLQVPAPAGK